MRTCTDVHAEINAPELLTGERVAVDIDLVGLAFLGVVLRSGGIPFHEQLIHAVTVHVADTHIIRRIGAAV